MTTATEKQQDGLEQSGAPNAYLSEQMLLGLLLSDNDSWDKLDAQLTKEHFYHPEHQIIFDAILSLIAKNVPTDELILIEELELRGELAKIGGRDYIASLAASAVTGMDVNAYAAQVFDRALRRKLLAEIGKIGQSARGDTESMRALLDRAEHSIFSLTDEALGTHNAQPIQTFLDDVIKQIDYRYRNQGELAGTPTGFTDLDRMTAGLQRADLVIIAGRPSMGKTSLALNIASQTSVMSGATKKATLFFSMEMPSAMLTMRLISMLGGINMENLRSGELSDQDWLSIRQATDMLRQAPIYLDDSVNLTPMEIRARVRRVMRTLPQATELGVIVVDYLQLMHLIQTNENRTTEMSEISRSLKGVAKEFNIPLIALSQLNRAVESRTNKRPVMADLRESGAIEQDADLILFIYRDELYNEASEEKGIAEVIIGKQRNGPTGITRLAFNGRHTSFYNLEEATEIVEYSE